MNSKEIENPESRIRYWRLSRGFTLDELSNMTGIDKSYISIMERNDRAIKLDHLRKIANSLNLKVADLLNLEDNPIGLNQEEMLLIGQMRTDPVLAHTLILLAKNPIKIELK